MAVFVCLLKVFTVLKYQQVSMAFFSKMGLNQGWNQDRLSLARAWLATSFTYIWVSDYTSYKKVMASFF